MTVLDQYFKLSDRANDDEQAFGELVELFAMQGRHIAEVDAQGKIYALEVHVSKAN